MSHLRGRKHQAAMAQLPSATTASISDAKGDIGEDTVIIDTLEEHQTPIVVQERIQAGKKRARKLRQKLSSKWVMDW